MKIILKTQTSYGNKTTEEQLDRSVDVLEDIFIEALELYPNAELESCKCYPNGTIATLDLK